MIDNLLLDQVSSVNKGDFVHPIFLGKKIKYKLSAKI